MKMKNNVEHRPLVLVHQPITFETAISGNIGGESSSFPGLGWGVGGVPGKERGDFPGGGATGGNFPGKGPKPGKRP
ncbi:hypothetical protein [Bacillus sp. PS06]|uniref:hypothetical protein n=1 Tax=Bacillus sp. PS06 TaxID=2764176 RepID=UPI001784AD1A|nr:hypothetical protein [Bacillus sp. PS06]MBD8071119.1 hypothetical protein [Bacillus sp. PS06]